MKIIQIPDQEKEQYMELLLEADDVEAMIRQYLFRGTLFALYDNGLRAVCVVTDEGNGQFEIKNIAVSPAYRRMGYGKALMDHVLACYRGRGDCMLVGTGDTPDMMGFYHNCGFCDSHRLVNYFVDQYPVPVMDNGRQLFDMIYLKQSLLSD